MCESFPTSLSTRVINYQLIKSATSTGANHRAAGRARSRAEFYSKLSITMEEADETIYWLEIIKASKIKCHQFELDFLITESKEISSIIAKARHTSKYGKRE